VNDNIFIPKKINVGFQERSDTYTKKLAYVIYFDNKNVLRKQKSWESWRNKKIEPITFDNVPTEGFVLNKKVGDCRSDWNHRQAYVRVYDPRDFEFEINIENLLYILENTSSIKGKGLEGEFIYGWHGKDLLLIPTSSPDFEDLKEFNDKIHTNKSFKVKDLIIGATYQTKQNEKWVYIGIYPHYDWYYEKDKESKIAYWFFVPAHNSFTQVYSSSTLSKKIIDTVDSNCYSDYAKLFDRLEHDQQFSPIDPLKTEYTPYELEEFRSACDRHYHDFRVYNSNHDLIYVSARSYNEKMYRKGKSVEIPCSYGRGSYTSVRYDDTAYTLEDLFATIQPYYKKLYLQNGKFLRKEYT
jgi:hypothetical protein